MTTRAALMVLVLLGFAPAEAASPSFDCGRAEGPAETLICGDETLAAMDEEMGRLFKLAVDAPDLMAVARTALNDAQRSWIEDREACADAGDPRACIEKITLMRIDVLRRDYARARSADGRGVSRGPYVVQCGAADTPTSVLFVNVDPPTALLEWPDRALAMTVVRTGSGVRYTAETDDGEVVFWVKGNEAQFQVPGHDSVTCKIG